MFSRVRPTPVRAPLLLAVADEVAALIGLSVTDCDPARLASVFSGNEILPGMDPHASIYGGHQFGHWAGQLGDGRAIILGEVTGPNDKAWTLQLKGAGATPYSRQADGRAVLRSSVREFLCSEAMFHLGVPTTRALSLVLSGDSVVRDMFYDGHPKAEPGAIVCRVAPSFVRFGHFELLAARGDLSLLETLLNFVIGSDQPELAQALGKSSEAERKRLYLDWFAEVCQSTQDMIVQWMRVGFVHGVMNTDNMSVLGLTIDYGPYGWVDDYDPDWTPNTTDAEQRRYRFGQQAAVARWNLYQLANALYPLIRDAGALQAILQELPASYESARQKMMAQKLGLSAKALAHPQFLELLDGLERILCCQRIDMTLFYRYLIEFACGNEVDNTPADTSLAGVIAPAVYPPEASGASSDGATIDLDEKNLPLFHNWEALYRQFLRTSAFKPIDRRATMSAANPAFVLRNYLVQQAIDSLEQGDRTEFDALQRLLRQPCETLSPANQRYAARRPAWATNRAGCSMLSCSS